MTTRWAKMNEIISTNPATLKELGKVTGTPEQKVKEHVSNAKASHPSWARLSFEKRAKYLLKARKYLLDNIDDIALTITRENGKPIAESISAEILPAADLFYWAAINAEKILSSKRICIGIFNLMLRRSIISHQPLGVVGVISPWNYPFSIPAGIAAMALMAGNCVILKPSSVTPLVGNKINEMFAAAGFPESVFTHIPGGSETGEALLNSRIDKIIFTGSVEIGKHIAAVCSRNMVPCSLELGGKDAAIIRADADIEHASSAVVWGTYTNAGQCCASIERAYIHESIAEKFIAEVVKKTGKLRMGNGEDTNTDIGPMTTLSQLQIAEAHVEDARRRGANILCGGNKRGPGYFFEPTVITGVDHTFACVNEESFGPLLPIMTFKDDRQAIQLANYSEYGLNAYIFTKGIKAGRQMAEQLRAGTVIINDAVYTHAIPQTPWGGVKHSGFGRTHSAWGFYELTNLHHIHINPITFVKDFWWYPYDIKLVNTLKSLSKTLTGGIFDKIRSLPQLLKTLSFNKS